MKTEEYFESLRSQTERAYDIAEEARSQSKDPEGGVDIPVAEDLPEKASSLVIAAKFPELEDSGVAERIRELEDEYGKNDERVSFEIAREIAEGEFHEFDDLERACEAGIRVGVSYMTGGITTAPLEGIGDVRIRENSDGTDYLAIYYSGPIRSAGGTASAMSVLLSDYVRLNVGLEEFKPSEKVVERYATEVDDYYNRVTSKQYYPDREETKMIADNVPVEVTGSPTEQLEVSNYKDLERVKTNRIRGGMCLVYLDGLPLKAPKIKKRIEKWGEAFGLEHWKWVEEYLELQEELHSSGDDDEEEEEEGFSYTPSDKFLDSMTAGRPVFGHPGKKGGFRLRYGHSRNNGLAATSVHPASMEITERFMATGTQLKTEYPMKGTVTTPCDSIHPPVARLENGDVIRVETREKAREIENKIDEILFLGDMLVAYGEFVENGKRLLPSPYVSEWWEKDLEKALKEGEVKLGRDFSGRDPTPKEAFKISEKLDIPLHPRWTYHWRETSVERFEALYEAVNSGELEGEKVKRCLEDILLEHRVEDGKIELEKQDLLVLQRLLKDNDEPEIDDAREIPGYIEKETRVELREQAPHYVGARMGRPEKAEKRTLEGRPQLLFPCGKQEGGRMRNLSESYRKGEVEQEIIHNKCPECSSFTYFSYCVDCDVAADPVWFCSDCGKEFDEEMDRCGSCGNEDFNRHQRTDIEVEEVIDDALDNLGSRLPELLKSPRGMSGKHRHVEPVEKGLLRQKYGLYVNKDGTVRYDATDIPMTHFRPREISTSVEKLREIGYTEDVNSEPLESEDQVLALKPQDIVIPDTDKSLPASDYFVNVAKFIDDLLEEFYGLKPYYNAEKKEDLIGELVIGLAPHTSGGTVGRIIGFTDAKGIYAHPYWHAGKRRNCLPGDAEVKMADGSTQRLRELYESAGEEEEVDSTGTVEKEMDEEVLTVDGKSINASKASKVIRTPAQDFKIEFETEGGRKFEVFPDHRVKTGEGVKKAREVEEGDKVFTPLEVDVETEDKKYLDLADMLLNSKRVMVRGVEEKADAAIKDLGGLKEASTELGVSKKSLGNYKYRDSIPLDLYRDLMQESSQDDKLLEDTSLAAKRDTVEIPAAIEADSDFMKLLGYYLAEGYTRKSEKQGEEFYQVCFAFGEQELEDNIREVINSVFGIEPSRQDHVLVISSRLVYELFKSLEVGAGAKEKRVPEFVKSLPKEKVADMLSAYFAGDGSVEKGRLHVQATSSSRKLLDDIDFLLKRFGIYTRYYQNDREAGGILVDKYGEEHYEGRTFTTNKLHIRSSHAVTFGKEIGFDLGRKQKALEADYKRERNPRIETDGELVKEEIRSKETRESEERFMYDIEVEETHNFVTRDNLVTNNCDGDEDAILLLMDGLLNFSRQFLPDMTGARSITKDTRIFVKRNEELLAPTAEELIDEVLEDEGYETRSDGFEVCRSFDDDIKAVSFSEDGDVGFTDVSALIRHENDKQVFRVKTSRGEISVTGDHSVFVTEGREIEAKPVREIEEGECIVVPSNPDLEAEGLPDKVDLFEVIPDEECYVKVPEEELEEIGPEIKQEVTEDVKQSYSEHNIYRYRTGRRDAPLKFYKEVGVVPSCKVRLRADTDPVNRFFEDCDELYRLLGYLLSEGALDRGDIYNTDIELIEDARDCIEKLTGVRPDIKEDVREERKVCYSVRVPAAFMKALEELGLARNKFDEKRVPSFVFGADKSKVRSFIEAYRSGDGSIYEEKGFSKLYTKSGEMASQLSLLLRKLGYKSSARQAGETWEVLYSEWRDKDPYWPLWDILDEARETLREDGFDYEDVKREFSNDRTNERMKTASKERVEDLYEKGVSSLEKAAEGDISVERVVEIEEADYGDDYVYDLEVPEKQNFLCGPHPVFAHNTMDAPLILSTVLNPDEVDDEAWAIETVSEYPRSFYEETQEYKYPWELDTDIEIGEDIVHSDEPFRHGYTHESQNIENGPMQSEYVTLDEMSEKTRQQLGLGEKLKAVEENKVADLLLQKHFIPDIKGNLRSFSSQEMRCGDCNTKFRRVPMTAQTIAPTGKTTAECPECGGKVLLTISEGTIKKYMEPSRDIVEEFEVSPYVRQQIIILKDTLQSLFGKDDRQTGIKQFTT